MLFNEEHTQCFNLPYTRLRIQCYAHSNELSQLITLLAFQFAVNHIKACSKKKQVFVLPDWTQRKERGYSCDLLLTSC